MRNKSNYTPMFARAIYPIGSALLLAFLSPTLTQANEIGRTASLVHVANQQQVTGTVSGPSGPLSGVTIRVKEDPSVATSTDEAGKFSINAKPGQTLVFQALGYSELQRVVSGTSMSVTLSEKTDEIDEVVIVGYGIQQKKESLTGAMQAVKGEKLRDITTPTVENMLNGKAAGVYVAPGNGRPGSRGGVVIRGQATLSGTTSPLWVIDGVIVGSSPGDLNPDDIVGLTVLKDAASTSIYGSQGANGVIVVTTKTPKAQKATISYSGKLGVNTLTNGNLEMMNGAELYDYYSSFQNANVINFPRWNDELKNSNFDWWKVATKSGLTQNHNVTIQGGNDNLQSLLSLGYYNEVGAVKGYDYKRYNVRLNNTIRPFDWLTIRPTLAGARRGADDQQYSITAMYTNFPWDNPYDDNGKPVPHRYSGWVNSAGTNYLYDLQFNHGNNHNYELMGGIDFDIKITDWLTFSSVNNYRANLYSSAYYYDPSSSAGESVKGRLAEYRSEDYRRYTNQILRFNKNWDKHSLSGILAYEFNDYRIKTLDVYGTGFIPGFEVLDVVAKPERTKGGISEWATQSILSKATYEYDNRYTLEGSFRRDGASNFGTNGKYGNFFSVSGGWNIHNESWFNFDQINLLKLRAAYGSVGNKPSSLYPQYSVYSVSSTSGYNENPGALISVIGNPDLSWENTYTTGVGLDFGLFNNRIRASFDYYNKDTDNILYAVPVTGLIGVTSLWKNVGEMNNRGIELNIGGDILRTDDLLWSIDINLGHNKNKLTKLYPTKDANGNMSIRPVYIGDGAGIAGSAQRILYPGLPVDTYYMAEWAGVNPEDGKPQWYHIEKDANGNETGKTVTSNYAEATQVALKKAAADLFGGISTNLAYKQFDLSATFGYSIGGLSYNYFRQEYDSDGTYTDRNQMKLQDGWSRWEKPGDIATHPVAKYNNKDNGNKASSRYLEENDFFRMRSLSLGYKLDLSKYNLNSVRFFLTGENLFTLTKYSGVDPEMSINDSGAVLNTAGPSVYPATRKFMFGLNVTF
ncbi:SusC/RagA family TonB-linked outer membrane protein [Sphingobacterium kyonggiense]